MAVDGDDGMPPGMRRYVLALYRRVAGRPDIPEPRANEIQEAHVTNLHRLTDSGDIIAAGPFEEETDLRGVILFSTDSVTIARELLRTDPAIVEGRLFLEYFTWWGPIGLEVDPEAAEADEVLRRLRTED